MTAGSGYEKPATGHLLASRADREQVVDVLKSAFAAERLTIDELDRRVGQAFASRTYAELAAITADIPAEPAASKPAASKPAGSGPTGPKPARRRLTRRRPTRRGPPTRRAVACAVAAAAGIAVAGAIGGPAIALLFAVFYFMALLVAGAQILIWRHETRLLQQPPPQAPRSVRPHPARGIRPQPSAPSAAHRWRPCVRRYAIGSSGH